MVKVTVIITVLNELDSLPLLVKSLKSQSRPPDEVVIVDGGSTDGTWNLLRQISRTWPISKVYSLPKSNRSQGRNFAISKAHSSIIAITDAGCLPHLDWLENLVQPFYDSATQVVSGYYEGSFKNVFQKSLIPYVLVMPDRIPSIFFPSTRSMALRKSVWQTLGGFNEALDPSEDFEYAKRLHAQGVKFVFVKNAVVSWQPRKNLSQSAWMFFHFAFGDIMAGIIRPKVKALAIRYLAFAYFFFLSMEIRPLFFLLIPIAFVYLILTIFKNYRYVKNIGAFFWLPVLQITADICVLFGTIVGFVARISIPNNPPKL